MSNNEQTRSIADRFLTACENFRNELEQCEDASSLKVCSQAFCNAVTACANELHTCCKELPCTTETQQNCAA